MEISAGMLTLSAKTLFGANDSRVLAGGKMKFHQIIAKILMEPRLALYDRGT